MTRKILLVGIILIILLGTFASSLYFSSPLPHQDETSKKDPVLDIFINPEDKNKLPQTGDILLWSNTTIDSLVIQQLTDGPYSHCGIIRKDPSGKTWVLDTYPEEGLRYVLLEEYLHPKNLQLVSVCLIRYQGQINLETIENKISFFNKETRYIDFDRNVILDESQMNLNSLEAHTRSIYCAELIYLILKDAVKGPMLFDNDYDRVISKWDALSQKSRRKSLDPLEYVKLFYMKMSLTELKDDPQKTLISPNGFLRSGSFNIISEVKDLAKPNYFKKIITQLPNSTDKTLISNKDEK